MKAMTNRVTVEGYLYEHALELKVSGPNSKNPNTEYITGTISIATDDACVNVVPVHYTYVTATTSKGNPNATFGVLKNIVDGVYGTIMADGKDKAVKLHVDSALDLNEFYSDRSGKEELVSAKRNEGGFVSKIDVLNEKENLRNVFEVDMIITGAVRREGDPERDIPEKVIVKGAIFNFRKALLPVEFSATHPNAMQYFEGLEATSKEPVFTKIKGTQISETVVKTITEESAFGEASIREVKSNRKDFVINWAAPAPYAWDDESTITAMELNEAITARETYLATLKQRQDEYKAAKSAPSAAATAAIANNTFNF